MSEEHNVVEEISHVDIFVDSKYLTEGVVIVDTPGLQALHPEHERITKKQIKNQMRVFYYLTWNSQVSDQNLCFCKTYLIQSIEYSLLETEWMGSQTMKFPM